MGKEKVSILLMYVILLLILPFISAIITEQSLGQIKQGDSILLRQNCINITYSNITSISMNGLNTQELIDSPLSMNIISNGYQTYSLSNSSLLGHYIVTGICDENGIVKSWIYDYDVTPLGFILSLGQVFIYLFFLFICLSITFFSIRLFKKNKYSKDTVKSSELYEMKKRNEFLYYTTVIKKHFWIIGVFGVYLSLLIFTALLNQLVYTLGLTELNNILQYVVLGFAWGLIPFTIFWFVWLIIIFYKSTTEIMKYQFGNIGRGGK
jgi:hypothetical protein